VSPPKKEIPANTGKVSKNTSAKASEHVSSSGGWVKASQYMPTGNFLDDAFRHQGLTHEDRIAIWAQITTESLPCQYNSDMEYKESAWFGRTEADASPICSVLDSAEMSNKPVYYYSVGFSQSPNMAVYSPAGIMIMHQGIIIHWNQEDMIVMPWDFVSSVKNIKEDEKTYKLVLKVDDEIDLHTEKEGLMFIFPKPGSMPGMDFPEKSELMNLVKLIKTRLKQLEPYRDKPFCIENDDWYFNLTEEVARKLCEEYILKKSKSDTPRTSSKGNVIPPQATKPQKTEKQSVDTQPQPLKKFEPLQPDKPPFKPVSGASQPTGPVTFLEFWQALKPVLDKLKFKGLSNVKLTENDWLNCKANIIVGVYHSIGILKTKKKIRLDCYIDTGNEVGNLQIIDYVQSKIKPVKTIKDRLVFDRKEGRRAQRIALFLDNFDLDNRNCWNTYIKEIADIMDDFVAAIDTCLKDL
jgi:ligand-binding SRPBCC domain-containing protein